MNIKDTLKEVILGIFPIIIFMTILQFTIAPIEMSTYIKFLISTVFVIVGLFLFLSGIELGFLKIGEKLSYSLIKTGHLSLILIFAALLGFIVTLLEPDVQIFSKQVCALNTNLTSTKVCLFIAVGTGLMVSIAFLNALLKISIKYVLIIGYTIIFTIIFLFPNSLSVVAFDAGGASTGALTVPFLLSFASGLNALLAKNNSTNYCIVGIASLGPILAILLLGVIA